MASSRIRSSTEGSVMRLPSSSRYSKPLPRRRRLMPGPEQSTRRSRATHRVCPAARQPNHRGRARGAAYPGSMPASLDGLSRAQLAAVTHPEGPLLVLAGAGTGKTRTLTSRFAWLVEQGVPAGADPRAHLLVARRGGDARAARGADRVALREPPRGHLPRVLRPPAPGRGAGGRRGPLPHPGHAGGPAGAAARAASASSRSAGTRSAATRPRCWRASWRGSTA